MAVALAKAASAFQLPIVTARAAPQLTTTVPSIPLVSNAALSLADVEVTALSLIPATPGE